MSSASVNANAVSAESSCRDDVRMNVSRSNVERVNAMLGEDTDQFDVRAEIDALSDADLVSFGLNAYRMNLLSLFGEAWTAERISQTAREATISKIWRGWEYHHRYLPSLGPNPGECITMDCPDGQVRALLERGRGLVMVSFHQGHMRFVPSDLAHRGIALCLPLARDSYNDYESARHANPDAALWANMKYANVEERAGSLMIARALAKGGMIFSTIDGNTGLDGPRGDDRRATVRILGRTAKVKDGLIRMAARFGSPVLPVIAHTIDGRPTCVTGPVLDPEGPLSGEPADRFVQHALQEAYDTLGRDLYDFAGEWCGGDLFHQWRVPEAQNVRALDEAEADLRLDLEAGGVAMRNDRRIIELSKDGDIVWTDALTLRSYRLPLEMAELADKLSPANGGVDRVWLQGNSETERSKFWAILCQLASRDAVRSSVDRLKRT